jgi:hypothetical protein
MFKITKEQALEAQEKQLAYYEPTFPGITAKIKAMTTADQLEPDTLYDMVTINRHIPRGVKIEAAIDLSTMRV